MKASDIIRSLVESASPTQANAWNRLLAGANALYTMYYTSHWKARGSNYYGDHLLYERLYKATHEDLDPIAEKAIGTTNDDTFINAYQWAQETSAKILDWDFGAEDAEMDGGSPEHLLLHAEREFVAEVSRVKDLLDERGYLTDGIDDFLQGLANKHEGHIYLLQQRVR